ncbi:hypothetical protein BpHYR1_051020 [Brachionus plicatilis]|uniref:Uncharacterized protein n=1 Tax=Brachionus plicatilis TaxID=10195 RepID=A0A3M7SQI8_BRAPC|nr:hypothetical protein BpHYR1_051020 [Brachionus plicatilis]
MNYIPNTITNGIIQEIQNLTAIFSLKFNYIYKKQSQNSNIINHEFVQNFVTFIFFFKNVGLGAAYDSTNHLDKREKDKKTNVKYQRLVHIKCSITKFTNNKENCSGFDKNNG